VHTVTIEDKDPNELLLNENNEGLMPVTLATLAMHLSVDEKKTFAHCL
jgi:hypothetical protein